jgi:hypothetical protein
MTVKQFNSDTCISIEFAQFMNPSSVRTLGLLSPDMMIWMRSGIQTGCLAVVQAHVERFSETVSSVIQHTASIINGVVVSHSLPIKRCRGGLKC